MAEGTGTGTGRHLPGPRARALAAQPLDGAEVVRRTLTALPPTAAWVDGRPPVPSPLNFASGGPKPSAMPAQRPSHPEVAVNRSTMSFQTIVYVLSDKQPVDRGLSAVPEVHVSVPPVQVRRRAPLRSARTSIPSIQPSPRRSHRRPDCPRHRGHRPDPSPSPRGHSEKPAARTRVPIGGGDVDAVVVGTLIGAKPGPDRPVDRDHPAAE